MRGLGFAALFWLAASSPSGVHALPSGRHRHSPAAPRSRPNFGPSLNHRIYEHKIDESAAVVEFLTVPGTAEAIHGSDAVDIALQYVASKLDLSPNDFVVQSSHTSDHNGATHVYLQQLVNGLPVINGFANVNVDKYGRVISFGSSFFNGQKQTVSRMGGSTGDDREFVVMSSSPIDVHLVIQDGDNAFEADLSSGSSAVSSKGTVDDAFVPVLSLVDPRIQLSPSEAVSAFAQHLNIEADFTQFLEVPVDTFAAESSSSGPSIVVSNVPFSVKNNGEVPAKLGYIQVDDGKRLELVWDLEVEMNDNWYHAHVHAGNGEVLSMVDWVADAAYNVFPLGTNDPESGPRVLVENPAHPAASPMGWHNQGAKNYTVTIGNNVYTHENLDGRYEWVNNYRPNGGSELNFDFPVNLKKQPSTYLDAAITNLFYWNNIIHDLYYAYGFTEKAGNFQHDNLGRGGLGNDAVIANAQDGSGYNNANFATPPDGQHGRMRMYVWDVTNPMRDGDMEAGIIIHEYSHGLSIRLTGGPANSGCLGWGESGGMGEGWGDFIATVLRTTAETNRSQVYTMGEYANGGHGIRKFPYSTDLKINPSTYGYVAKPGYWGVHAKGEVWAEILYEVYWNLVDKHGFDPDWFNTGLKADTPVIPTPRKAKDDDDHHRKSPKKSKKHTQSEQLTADQIHSGEDGTYFNIFTGQWDRKPLSALKKKPAPPSKPSPAPPSPPSPNTAGNIMAIQLVIDGMKLQPCYPSFVDARDAILQADEINYGGENACEIWRGFAKRGMGVGARSGGRESFTVPAKCQ
ncbi:Fungalysin/Thermolysin Extracellular metalloproteinase 5 [Quaeritorhiza haematococci]|nr:Fungalysin/Thermolysin Extracellular metalloproteinase 5 [Quaeritorhiza haematococci]